MMNLRDSVREIRALSCPEKTLEIKWPKTYSYIYTGVICGELRLPKDTTVYYLEILEIEFLYYRELEISCLFHADFSKSMVSKKGKSIFIIKTYIFVRRSVDLYHANRFFRHNFVTLLSKNF